MSDYANYDEVIQAILSSDTAVNDKYKAAGDASSTLCDINQTVNQIQDMIVVRNRGGEVIGYDYRYTTPRLPNTSIMEVDSNTDNGWYGTGGGGHTSGGGAGRYNGSYYAGQVDTSESSDKMNSTGLVSGLISSTYAGVGILAKFGKNVAGAAADAIETLGSGVASAFNDLFVDAGNVTANSIRALFGVDSQGNTNMYLDEDVIGAYAIKAKEGGFLNQGNSPEYRLPVMPAGINLYHSWQGKLGLLTPHSRYFINSYTNYIKEYTVPGGVDTVFIDRIVSSTGVRVNYVYQVFISLSPFSIHQIRYQAYSDWTKNKILEEMDLTSGKYTVNNVDVYMIITDAARITGNLPTSNGDYIYYPIDISIDDVCYYVKATATTDSNIWNDLAKIYAFGQIVPASIPIDGITTQDSSTNPADAIVSDDPHEVISQLVNTYPQIMGSPIQMVTMDDSCNEVTKNYYSIPISYSPTNLNINAPITGGTQINPTFNPDVSLDLPDINLDNYVDQIIKILGGSGAGEDVTAEPVPEDPDTPSTDIDGGGLPVSVPQTGEGDTPTVIPPTVDVKSMWHVYNPQVEGLTALGAWLWSNSIWQQIVEMFTNPMEAIMGVHAIYAQPDIGSQVPIVVGYLTSTANANIVTSQYKSLSCGEIWLTEYFGNVFDYEPFTTLQLYLPYVGIVPLSVADCMRAKIGVSYVIDFYTGACVAKVSVTRDGAGGVLYEFPGNCAVEYPVSGASYSRMLQSIVASAASAVAVGVRTAGAPGTAALGALAAGTTFVSGGEKMQVQHSGTFGGNHGAMGSKIPYLIITRPQTNTAINFEYYDGYHSNYVTQLKECKGYTKCKEVHLNCPGAYKQELDEIESLLLSGVLFGSL